MKFTTYPSIIKAVSFILLFCCHSLFAQDSLQTRFKSYNSFDAPLIEDNSFLIEEAFNQGANVVQFISTCYFEDIHTGDMAYSFTHEIPLKDVKHQFSYTVNYLIPTRSAGAHGLGDVLINYRYELLGKNDWALVTPRISAILPTGDFSRNLGLGAWGGQFNLPVSKMLSKKLVTHYNAGFTFFKDAKFDLTDANNGTFRKQHDLTYFNMGASIIWMPVNKFNVMFEYLCNFNDAFEPTGEIVKEQQMIFNPGFRYAFDMGKCQIVPGFSMPVAVQDQQTQVGAFIYLSIEPNFGAK